MDTKLNFQSHISQILIKLTSSVRLLWGLYFIGNRELLLATYYGSIMSYAIAICGGESENSKYIAKESNSDYVCIKDQPINQVNLTGKNCKF